MTTRPARRTLSAALTLLVCAASAFAQGDPTIRVDVRLVRILATVKDSGGALVGGLNKDAFELRDNGAPQEIAVFERQTDQPLSVALLVDASGSTAKDLKFEVDSVNRFVKALLREGNPKDSIALYSFNWQVSLHNDFSRNAAGIDRSLRALHGEAGTSLYDAVMLASRDIEEREGRKILVVVTDGGDTTSHTDFTHAIEAAQIADAVIYPLLVVPITNDAGRNTGGENALTTMAARTGGRVFQPTLGAQLDGAFDQILRDLRTQYLLGFYPRNVPLSKDPFHTLTLRAIDPQFRISARAGYYGETAQESPAARTDHIDVTPGSDTVRIPKKPPATKTSPDPAKRKPPLK